MNSTGTLPAWAAGSHLLAYVAGKEKVDLDGLRAALERERVRGLSSPPRGVVVAKEQRSRLVAEDDSALHVLLRRTSVSHLVDMAVATDALPDMVAELLAFDPGAVLEVGVPVEEGFKIIGVKGDMFTVEGGSLHSESVPRSMLRAVERREFKRGAPVALAVPWKAADVLTILIEGAEQLDSALFDQVMTLLVRAIKQAEPATTIFDGCVRGSQLPRYMVPNSPLYVLCCSSKVSLRGIKLLLEAFPRAVRSESKVGWTPLHALLANSKATTAMLEAVRRATEEGGLHAFQPPQRGTTGGIYRVKKIKKEQVVLAPVLLQRDAGRTTLTKKVSRRRLHRLYAPLAAAPVLNPSVGEVVQLKSEFQQTIANLAVVSCTAEDQTEASIKAAADHARDLFTWLGRFQTADDLASVNEQRPPDERDPDVASTPGSCKCLVNLASLLPAIFEAVLAALPPRAVKLWTKRAVTTDGWTPMHQAASVRINGAPLLALLKLVHGLDESFARSHTNHGKIFPLHMLCTAPKVSVETLDFLLANCPEATKACDQQYGRTPLHYLVIASLVQSDRKERQNVLSHYIRAAPACVSIKDKYGLTPVEHLFNLQGLTALDFAPFIKTAPNPLMPCAIIADALEREALRTPSKRVHFRHVADELRGASSRIARDLPLLAVRNANGSQWHPFGSGRAYVRALLLPEVLMPPTAEAQAPGPLALAVQHRDRDFCSAEMVRTFCNQFLLGPCSLRSMPLSQERQPLRLKGLAPLPTLKQIYDMYWVLCAGGQIRWAISVVEVLYVTVLVAYRPSIACQAPSVHFALNLLVRLAVMAGLAVAQPVQEELGGVEGAIYIYALGNLVGEGTQLLTQRMRRYLSDPFNSIDLASTALLLTAAALRLFGAPVETLQAVLTFSSAVFGLRLLSFLQLSRSVGSLVFVITSMVGLLVKFLVIVMIVYSGFVIGMHGLLADAAPDTYGTLPTTALTLFRASVGGEYSEVDFGNAPEDTVVAAHSVMVVFLLLTTLLLLNLLIAFLTDAYSKVSEDKEKAFAFSRAAAVVELGEQVHQGLLPVPFNLLQVSALHKDWIQASRASLLFFTVAVAPVAMVLHWIALVLALPVLVFLVLKAGARGRYDEEAQKKVTTYAVQARETARTVLFTAVMLPLNLLAELRVVYDNWFTSHGSLEKGEWVYVLNTRKHTISCGRFISQVPSGETVGLDYWVEVPVVPGATVDALALSPKNKGQVRRDDPAFTWMVLGRLAHVSQATLKEAIEWSKAEEVARQSATASQAPVATVAETARGNLAKPVGEPDAVLQDMSLWLALLLEARRLFEGSELVKSIAKLEFTTPPEQRDAKLLDFQPGDRVVSKHTLYGVTGFAMEVEEVKGDKDSKVTTVRYHPFASQEERRATLMIRNTSHLYRSHELTAGPADLHQRSVLTRFVARCLESPDVRSAMGTDDDLPPIGTHDLNSHQMLRKIYNAVVRGSEHRTGK